MGGFGISAANNLLLIDELHLVKQMCTSVSVAFDDAAVANYFDDQVDAGLQPERFARIWIHTHPGCSAAPSPTDEDTFRRVFGSADWAVMFILASEGQSYARLRFNVGPKGSLQLPAEVNFHYPFPASEQGTWEEEYLANVQVPPAPFGEPSEWKNGLPVDAFGVRLDGVREPLAQDDDEWHFWRQAMDDLNCLEEFPP